MTNFLFLETGDSIVSQTSVFISLLRMWKSIPAITSTTLLAILLATPILNARTIFGYRSPGTQSVNTTSYIIDEDECRFIMGVALDRCNTNTRTAKFGGQVRAHCSLWNMTTRFGHDDTPPMTFLRREACSWIPVIECRPHDSSQTGVLAIHPVVDRRLQVRDSSRLAQIIEEVNHEAQA